MNAKVINGLGGAMVIDDSAPHLVNATILKALGGDVVFTGVIGNLKRADGSDGLAGKTLSNGDFVVGVFSQVQIASGVLLAYYNPAIPA